MTKICLLGPSTGRLTFGRHLPGFSVTYSSRPVAKC